MRWLDSITDSTESIYVNLSKLRKTVEDRGARRAAVHRVTKLPVLLGERSKSSLRWERRWEEPPPSILISRASRAGAGEGGWGRAPFSLQRPSAQP